MNRIAICDDESWMLDRLEAFLIEYGKAHERDFEILRYNDANALLRDYPANLDLILLDIAMNGLDGIAAAGEIRKKDNIVSIIFITSMLNRAIDGYRVHAYGFIKKPVDNIELEYQLTAVLAQIDSKKALGSYINLTLPQGTKRIPVFDVSYAEVKDHKISVHIGAEIWDFWLPMNELEKQLADYGFFRPHSSYLVNYRYISRIGTSELTLVSGIKIPISQHRRKDFLEKLSKYTKEMG